LLIFIFLTTLSSFFIFYLTSKGPATALMGRGIALNASKKGIDDATEINQLRRELKKQGGTLNLKKYIGFNVVVQEQDIEKLSPREVRFHIFQKVAEPLYTEGADAFIAQVRDRNARQEMLKHKDKMFFATAEFHRYVSYGFVAACIVTVLFFLLLIALCRGKAKLAVPAIIVMLGSLPLVVVFSAYTMIAQSIIPIVAKGHESEALKMSQQIIGTVLQPTITFIFVVSLIAFLVGVTLVIVSLIVKKKGIVIMPQSIPGVAQ
jgi:hypothetical protein